MAVVPGQLNIMGDHGRGYAFLLDPSSQQRKELVGVPFIQAARRFIGQQYLWSAN
jgi:hypothetical protein